MRFAWLAGGLVCVVLGGVGIVVPGLPATVFFIGATACFTRSSPRMEAWVLDLPVVGAAVRDHRAGLGMPLRAKQWAIGLLVVSVGVSAWFLPNWWVRTAVLTAAAIGVWAILRQPSKAR